MNETQQHEVTKENFPSLDLVYPLAIESYETSRQRMITQDARIHQVITLALAITAGAPALYQIFGLSPYRLLLIVAGVFFFAAIFLLVAALMRSTTQGISITALHRHYIALPPADAMEAIIKYAGEQDEESESHRRFRHGLIIGATVCLVSETFVLALSGLFH